MVNLRDFASGESWHEPRPQDDLKRELLGSSHAGESRQDGSGGRLRVTGGEGDLIVELQSSCRRDGSADIRVTGDDGAGDELFDVAAKRLMMTELGADKVLNAVAVGTSFDDDLRGMDLRCPAAEQTENGLST